MKKAVIGLGFGDEGKGITTDYLCSIVKNPLVVRFSGGHQAGHTVCNVETRHKFSNFGSGTLRGVPTYWSENCTVDPVGLLKEFRALEDKGIHPIIYINANCPITTPYDKRANRVSDSNKKHGTVGVGFGSTIQREEDHYSLTFQDLFHQFVLATKLDMIEQYYEFPVLSHSYYEFIRACSQIIKLGLFIRLVHEMPHFDNYIYEGSQGLMLDPKIGFFPHVTRSDMFIEGMDKYYFVTRAYCTRHGNGPMPNENIPFHIEINPEETNIQHKYQGKFRRTMLDVNLLKYAIEKTNVSKGDNNITLVITCLDHIKHNYCFTHNGTIIMCHSEYKFIRRIAKILNINKAIISKNEDSYYMEEITIS